MKPRRLGIIFTIGILCVSVLLSVTSKPAEAAALTTFTVENGLLKAGNAFYEIAFSAADGSVAYILDRATGQPVCNGSSDNSLWAVTFDHGAPIGSGAYSGQFQYAWDAAGSQLTLTYTGNLAATVTMMLPDARWLKMQAVVTNNTGATVSNFNFPNGLRVTAADVRDALIPMLPGALLNSNFFSKRGTFANEYPGALFADYAAIRSGKGKLALYGQGGSALQPVFIGFEPAGKDSPDSRLTHNYRTWIANAKTWSSPWVFLHIGEDYPATIQGYRTDNGINSYQSLATKLGKAADAYFAAPMYKLDLAALRLTFAKLKTDVIDKLNVPGIIHLVALEPRGYDKNYPDFIPPDPRWGTTTDLASLVSYVHSKNGLVVPYTNFSWWDNNGPTLLNLPGGTTLPDVVAEDNPNSIILEKYGPNVGVVMNLHHPFVQNKIAEQHAALRDTVGADGIFEDQWGARNAPYDYNPAGLSTYDPATSYFEGVIAHYQAHADNRLMTEMGVDVLAKNGVGFAGSNYLWDMLGYRGATAPFTSYYPMAGMMFRDKVLFYQHDLAAETWTKNREILRWNLAQGYNLSNAFFDQAASSLNMNNPWLNLIGVFQKYALSHYADQLVTGYDDLGNGVIRTSFSSYVVDANNGSVPYTLDGSTLPPGGAVTRARDGSVTAGVFTAYNGNALSEGEHYLVEVRAAARIQVFQPVGPDTPLHIRATARSEMAVTAHRYDGTVIATVPAAVSGSDIRFDYAGTLNGQTVGYYEITGVDVLSSPR